MRPGIPVRGLNEEGRGEEENEGIKTGIPSLGCLPPHHLPAQPFLPLQPNSPSTSLPLFKPTNPSILPPPTTHPTCTSPPSSPPSSQPSPAHSHPPTPSLSHPVKVAPSSPSANSTAAGAATPRPSSSQTRSLETETCVSRSTGVVPCPILRVIRRLVSARGVLVSKFHFLFFFWREGEGEGEDGVSKVLWDRADDSTVTLYTDASCLSPGFSAPVDGCVQAGSPFVSAFVTCT